MNAVRFMFDGTRLEEQKTPGDYGMEDQDVIDVMSSQVGGYQ
jgi:small ubiquitin-related modifier